jgi:hypothetical protein
MRAFLQQVENLVPLLLVAGLGLRPIYRRCPKPTFNYHGPNSFWLPLLLILTLVGASSAMLVLAGPLAVWLLIADTQHGGITIRSAISAAIAIPVSLYAWAEALRSPLFVFPKPEDSNDPQRTIR